MQTQDFTTVAGRELADAIGRAIALSLITGNAECVIILSRTRSFHVLSEHHLDSTTLPRGEYARVTPFYKAVVSQDGALSIINREI